MKRLKTSDFNYHLPTELIAQKPANPRDRARLMVVNKKSDKIDHEYFYQIIDRLNSGDVLVLNDSKVIPARLIGKKETGGKMEIFLLKKDKTKSNWEVLIKGKIKIGQKIFFKAGIESEVLSQNEKTWLVKFNISDKKLLSIGQTPLPPYIKANSKLSDYQTVYAKHSGSVAAPTAGLHFTPQLLKKIKQKGVRIEYVTLHVGLGTFLPVKTKYIQEHKMHSELAIISPQTAKSINLAKKNGHKIIACGTTAVRTLEAMSDNKGNLKSGQRWLDIFIYPGYKFNLVDGIITNFHLPQSTLLMLVSAFAGSAKIKKAYARAIKNKYHFYSFGDAMLLT
ncbi:MAG: tRNA preQ1(34) S-adenosylmethionine ribosyltransferase-isomerase QueA [bacterium]